MTDDEMLARLDRVYAALDEVRETDPVAVRAALELKVLKDDQGMPIGFGIDPNDGWRKAKLENHVFMLISNLARLHDHARKWLADRHLDPNLANQLRQRTRSLQLLTDMENADKHGGTKRSGGLHSGTQPALRDLMRMAEFSAETAAPDQTYGIVTGGAGEVEMSGKANLAIFGIVCDSSGKFICMLNVMLAEALEAWECFFADHGLNIKPTSA